MFFATAAAGVAFSCFSSLSPKRSSHAPSSRKPMCSARLHFQYVHKCARYRQSEKKRETCHAPRHLCASRVLQRAPFVTRPVDVMYTHHNHLLFCCAVLCCALPCHTPSGPEVGNPSPLPLRRLRHGVPGGARHRTRDSKPQKNKQNHGFFMYRSNNPTPRIRINLLHEPFSKAAMPGRLSSSPSPFAATATAFVRTARVKQVKEQQVLLSPRAHHADTYNPARILRAAVAGGILSYRGRTPPPPSCPVSALLEKKITCVAHDGGKAGV